MEMALRTDPAQEPRTPLSRERVLRAAIALVDVAGIESLTMRRLGQELQVEAMSLYNHVADKDDILDGLADLVFSESCTVGPSRLEDGHATTLDLSSRRPAAPPLGAQSDAVTGKTRSGDPPTP